MTNSGEATGREFKLYCPRRLMAEYWPHPLVEHWHALYPEVIDEDDVGLTKNQANNHFAEFFAAVHLFQARGCYALIEKYGFSNHRRKVAWMERLFEAAEGADRTPPVAQRGFTKRHPRAVLDGLVGQPPDLLLQPVPPTLLGFAEVKRIDGRSRDSTSKEQKQNHERIEKKLGLPVDVIEVHLVDAAR